ncbi:hypothetical protein [Undibacterium sp. Ren11W]|uniref:hypothetical protein n=1 Tax=Undibacterium sp. Ren11W TaxID=3413045 RepID=UPI003BF2738C
MKKLIKNRAMAILLLCFIPLMNACAEKKMNLTVVVYNYWPRGIMDVSINGQYAGGSFGAYGPGGTGGSMVAGVPIHVGEQKIEWALSGGEHSPRLGEKITASAMLKDIPSDSKVLAIHIYPDETIFVETARWLPGERLKDVAK